MTSIGNGLSSFDVEGLSDYLEMCFLKTGTDTTVMNEFITGTSDYLRMCKLFENPELHKLLKNKGIRVQISSCLTDGNELDWLFTYDLTIVIERIDEK